jgi:hypothetical protein
MIQVLDHQPEAFGGHSDEVEETPDANCQRNACCHSDSRGKRSDERSRQSTTQ